MDPSQVLTDKIVQLLGKQQFDLLAQQANIEVLQAQIQALTSNDPAPVQS